MIYIKLIGAVLIIVSSAGIGVFVGAFERNRTKDIRELIKLSGIIKGSLTYTCPEIADILEQGASKTNGAVSLWLSEISDRLSGERNETFFDIWESSAWVLKNESYLSGEVIAHVLELGKWLCYMDTDTQIENILLWENDMNVYYERQQKKAEQINKVSGFLGLLGGILLVVLIC